MVAKLYEHPAPTSKAELKSFLGLASQLLSHTKEPQAELSELFKLTGKRSAFVWQEVHASRVGGGKESPPF
jgi:hypothetical protein